MMVVLRLRCQKARMMVMPVLEISWSETGTAKLRCFQTYLLIIRRPSHSDCVYTEPNLKRHPSRSFNLSPTRGSRLNFKCSKIKSLWKFHAFFRFFDDEAVDSGQTFGINLL